MRLIHWVVWVLRWSRRRRRWKAWNAWNNPSNDYYYYFVKVITLMARRLFWHFSGLEVIGKAALTKESKIYVVGRWCVRVEMIGGIIIGWIWLRIKNSKQARRSSYMFELKIDHKLCNNDKHNIKSKLLPSFPKGAQAWRVLGWRRAG